ncbi:D-serine ammonia-lyase [Rothia uropygialis]|uniref:D-serine ammonia-lyase n=1 Tax=Kocuria sp. 36 TaxID=1415402 RepID=UPI00101BF3F6|nr:D-serine ammonia-lyase [Kocuria sp. 36]
MFDDSQLQSGERGVLNALRTGTATAWIQPPETIRRPEQAGEATEPFGSTAAPAPSPVPATVPSRTDLAEAAERFRWYAPLVREMFPETKAWNGIIESRLLSVGDLQEALHPILGSRIPGNLWVKCDNELPVTASVKSRGGIHEVFALGHRVLQRHGLPMSDGALQFMDPHIREIVSGYRLVVGSTGNLGLSIGLMGRTLGFSVSVHMSADAKTWKKTKLREAGAEVVEHAGNFSVAVTEARETAELEPTAFFIDDERSLDLFLGYAVAGARVAGQLRTAAVHVTADRPLFVYLPCGVGGAPGGITYGLKQEFGENVHCIFVEPTHAPAVFLGRLTGLDDGVHVEDIGLDGSTEADGLAVQRPSGLVGQAIGSEITGFVTVDDEPLIRTLAAAHHAEGLRVEPSACAGIVGATRFAALDDSTLGIRGITRSQVENGTHLAWLTGGNMMPQAEFTSLIARGTGQEI